MALQRIRRGRRSKAAEASDGHGRSLLSERFAGLLGLVSDARLGSAARAFSRDAGEMGLDAENRTLAHPGAACQSLTTA